MAAQNGTITMVSKSGRTYLVDVYAPDAAGGFMTFNPTSTAASTSPTQFRVPENVVITDYSFAAAPTATAFGLTVNNSAVIGGMIRYANVLNSLPYRIPLRIPLNGGDFLGSLNFA
jgi:hypothetical protein